MSEIEQGTETATTHLFPLIPGIDALFGKPLFSLDSNATPDVGFRRKSSIVIEGPPGSGKTAATLAMCRALMPEPAKMLYYLSTEVTKERLFKNHSEFGWFTHFNDIQSHDAVFTSKNLFFAELPRARTDRPLPSSAELINEIFRGISNDRRQEDRRYRPSLIIVDSLSGLLRDASTPGERRRLTEDFLERLNTEFEEDLGLVFLITESSPGPNDETPLEQYIADYVFRLGHKALPGGRRIRTLDIVKSHGTFMTSGKHTWDFFTEATADTVFYNNDLKKYVWSFREAGLQSQNGLSEKQDERSVKNQRPATIVFYPQWSTYMAIPSKTVIPSNKHKQTEKVWSGTPGLDELLEGDTEYWSRPDKWSQNQTGAKWAPGLRPGETSLMLGSSGTGKTWLLIQFLFGNLHNDGVILGLYDRSKKMQQIESNYEHESQPKQLKQDWPIRQALKRTLLISFEGTPSSLRSHAESSKFIKYIPQNSLCYFLPPSGLHLNNLLFELRWIVSNIAIERIAIDGLADLLKSVPSEQRPGIAAAIFRTLQNDTGEKNGNQRATIFATYELNPSNDLLTPDVEGVSAICENVIVLRQIRLNDQMHKAIYVLKAQSRRHDRQVRELKVNSRDTGNTPGVRVQSGFEGFSDILSDSPKKSRVALQLFRENEAEKDFNEELRLKLQDTFAFKIDLHTFAHTELSQFLDSARGILGQVPATDIKVLTLDEWWLRDLQRSPQTLRSQELGAMPPPPPLLRIDGFFALKNLSTETTQLFPLQQQRTSSENQGLASEHWITEVEKGVRTTEPIRDLSPIKLSDHNKSILSEKHNKFNSYEFSVKFDAELQAMPNYSDFGLFCLNKDVAKEVLGIQKEQLQSRSEVTELLPSLWAFPTDSNSNQPWFQPPVTNEHYDTIADLLFKTTKEGKTPENGFSFDMSRGENAICVLMELAWSFGVDEAFLSQAAINFVRDQGAIKKDNLEAEAFRSALRLLQYLVYHGLMVPYPIAKTNTKAILSRQWYSTLNIANELDIEYRSTSKEKKSVVPVELDLVPVPFFPVGMLPGDIKLEKKRLILAELVDISKYLGDLCNRVRAALEWVSEYRTKIVTKHDEDNQKDNQDITRKIIQNSANNVRKIFSKVKKIHEEIKNLNTELKSHSKTVSEITKDTLSNDQEKLISQIISLSQQVLDSNSGLSARQLRWETWIKKKTVTLQEAVDVKQLKENQEYQAKQQKLDEWINFHQHWAAAGMSMDQRDFRQMVLWLNQRIDVIRTEINTMDKSDVPVALHGFACSGSWMLGVLRNTHSPGLSWKLIEEMTSREANKDRAEMEAGIPTRKDFYDFYGETKVPRIPDGFELSWSDFLTLAGSKVRRRDRAVCSKVPLSQLSLLLREQMIRCIDVALLERKKRATEIHDWKQHPDGDALKRMNETVNDSVQNILHYIAVEQNRQPHSFPLGQNNKSANPTLDRCGICPLADGIDGEDSMKNGSCGVGVKFEIEHTD